MTFFTKSSIFFFYLLIINAMDAEKIKNCFKNLNIRKISRQATWCLLQA